MRERYVSPLTLNKMTSLYIYSSLATQHAVGQLLPPLILNDSREGEM